MLYRWTAHDKISLRYRQTTNDTNHAYHQSIYHKKLRYCQTTYDQNKHCDIARQTLVIKNKISLDNSKHSRYQNLILPDNHD